MWRQLKLGGKLLQCGDGYGDLLENFREPNRKDAGGKRNDDDLPSLKLTYPPTIGYPTRKFHLPTIHFHGLR